MTFNPVPGADATSSRACRCECGCAAAAGRHRLARVWADTAYLGGQLDQAAAIFQMTRRLTRARHHNPTPH